MQNKSSRQISSVLLGCLFCMAVQAEVAMPNFSSQTVQNAMNSTDDLELSESEQDNIAAEIPIEEIRSFIEVFDMVKQNYVAPITDQKLFENALHGLVEQLDPYSRYLDAQHYQQLLEFTEGEIAEPYFSLNFNGISQTWQLDQVEAGSVNYRQGLRNGMTIEKINNISIYNLDQKKIKQLLTGSLGSSVKLDVMIDNKVKYYDVLRDRKISYDIEPYLTNDRILILKIKAFQKDSTQQIENALKLYQNEIKLRGILIDVRDNPGGLLAAAVDLADLFLEQGLIVTTKGRLEPSQRFQAMPGAIGADYPIRILQNRYSASAAEVFTAAMREHQRVRVFGERSYGKGAVQKLFPLKQGAIQLTVSHYYTPQGHLIEGKGVEPDVKLVMGTELSDQQILQQALDLFNYELYNTTK